MDPTSFTKSDVTTDLEFEGDYGRRAEINDTA
jgi:hypothetical protein